MPSSEGTLRGKLLRWLLIPLSVLFVLDAIGSYFIAGSLSRRVYDGELMEIARELALHVRRAGEGIGFDLEADAERTLLLDEYDKVYYAVRSSTGTVVAGDASLRPPDGVDFREPGFYDGTLHGDPVRVAVLRTGADAGSGAPPAVIEVAETLGKRRTLAREIFIDGLLPQLLLILIACGMVWVGVARGLSPLSHLQRAVAARSHVDLEPGVGSGRARRGQRAGRRDQRPDGAARRRAVAPEPVHRRCGPPTAHAGCRAQGARRACAARERSRADPARARPPLHQRRPPRAPGLATLVAGAQRAQHGAGGPARAGRPRQRGPGGREAVGPRGLQARHRSRLRGRGARARSTATRCA